MGLQFAMSMWSINNVMLAVSPIGGPLEYYLQRKQNVPQCTCPCLFLAELQLDRCLPYLVLDNPDKQSVPPIALSLTVHLTH